MFKIRRSLVFILTMSLSLVSCSTYPSKFKCSDAKGLGCTMLSEIDRQIDNGQIEEAYLEKTKKCKLGRCSNFENSKIMPQIKQANILDENKIEVIE